MLKNKKGDWKALSAIILAVVFAIIVLGFLMPNLSSLMTSGSNKQACKTWVSLQARTKIAGFKVAEMKNPCITEKKDLKVNEEKPNEMYKSLADSMYDCWDMYGQGKIDFFSEWKTPFSKGPTYCILCSRITVDKQGTLDMKEFGEYLNSHNPPNHQETYAQFLLNSENGILDVGANKISLDSNDPVYVMLRIVKANAHEWKKAAVAGGVGTIIAGELAFTGALLVGTGIGAPVGVIALAAGAIIYTTTVFSGAEVFIPTLTIVSGKDLVKQGCGENNIYYNPRKSLIPFLDKDKDKNADDEFA
ncbi:MAG: hypothetical protein KKG60_03125 [Nanoarchaeota archaeon]|nr:hypothetical protein [Nanoarchaeota archaeon]